MQGSVSRLARVVALICALLGVMSGKAIAQSKTLVPYNNKSLDYYFFVTLEEAVKRAVADRGWAFQATNASFDSTKQLNQWQNVLVKGPKAIVSNPIDSQAIVSVIKRTNAKKIPIGIVDTPAAGGFVDITVDFDNYQGGAMAAEEILRLLKAKNGSYKGTVLNCYGALQSVAWRLRKEGFEAVMNRYPEVKLYSRPTEGQLDKMQSVTLATLAEVPTLDAVHAPSETPARGIVSALKQKGKWKKVGEEGHVIMVTIDGEPGAIEWIRDGYADASVSQDPIAYGQIAVELLEKYSMKGEKVPLGPYENKKYFWERGVITDSITGPSLVIPPFYINASNVDDKRHWGNVAWNEWGLRYN